MKRKRAQTSEMPIFDHFKELRKVFLISAYAVAIGTICGWALSDLTYSYLAAPVTDVAGVSFITTTPMEPILVKLKVSLIVGVTIAVPVLLWQLWSFILPALKKSEKRMVYFIVPPSVVLFIGGIAFAFLVVMPLCLKFLLFAGSAAVDSTPFLSKSAYLSFVITFLLSFGVVFQLPVVLLVLIRLGYVSPASLAKYRKYAFFVIVVVAVIISPTPDLATQALMITPMYLLYEMSIWLGYLVSGRRKKALAREGEV